MENFEWTNFTKKGAVKSDLKTIYNAWTIPSELEKWFLKSTKFSDTSGHRLDPNQQVTPGSYEWAWYNYDLVEKGKLLKVNGTDQLSFTFAGDCIVEVKLTEKDEFILVSITQRNIPTDDQSKLQIRLGCSDGWAYFLMNLKSVYEGGLDLRLKNNGVHRALYSEKQTS